MKGCPFKELGQSLLLTIKSRLLNNVRRCILLAFLVGLFIGVLPSAEAAGGHFFAGYKRQYENKGSRGYIGYMNPTVSYAGSGEWVMSGEGNGTNYIQTGWLKEVGDSGPKYFAEYGCSSVCRYEWESVPSNTTHFYEVSHIYVDGKYWWAAFIDGNRRLRVEEPLTGMGASAVNAYWSGETWDDRDQLGGTILSHLRFSQIQYKSTGGSWIVPGDSLLVSITTGSTSYRASKGVNGSYTWIDNWTE